MPETFLWALVVCDVMDRYVCEQLALYVSELRAKDDWAAPGEYGSMDSERSFATSTSGRGTPAKTDGPDSPPDSIFWDVLSRELSSLETEYPGKPSLSYKTRLKIFFDVYLRTIFQTQATCHQWMTVSTATNASIEDLREQVRLQRNHHGRTTCSSLHTLFAVVCRSLRGRRSCTTSRPARNPTGGAEGTLSRLRALPKSGLQRSASASRKLRLCFGPSWKKRGRQRRNSSKSRGS